MQEPAPLSGCFVRLFWVFGGPCLLIISAIVIATHNLAFPGIADVFYGIILIATVIARYIDKPQSNEESPSNQQAIVMYDVIFTISGIVLWTITHFAIKGLI